jgi:hypothetical protein
LAGDFFLDIAPHIQITADENIHDRYVELVKRFRNIYEYDLLLHAQLLHCQLLPLSIITLSIITLDTEPMFYYN